MADELIDILSKDGTPTGEFSLKSEAHRLGLFHASVHIWLYTNEAELLLQKRAKDKDTYPELWDISVAGHVGTGEKPEDCAIREIEEEIGLSITKNDLEFIGTYRAEKKPKPDLFDNELHYIYLSKLHIKPTNFRLQKEEVSDLKFIDFKTFREEVLFHKKKQNYVPHDTEYYTFIIENILKRFS